MVLDLVQAITEGLVADEYGDVEPGVLDDREHRRRAHLDGREADLLDLFGDVRGLTGRGYDAPAD